MKSTVETLSPTRVRLAVEMPFDELRPSLDRAYKAIAGQVRIPGFRPGKAPARIIDQRVGRATVLQEAVQEALPRAYSEAISSNEVRPVGRPNIELTRLDDGDTIEFTAEVDVRPEVTLPDLGSLEVSVDDVESNDDDVDQEISRLRDQFAVLTGADRPARDGDFVSIDLFATVDGEEVEGGSTTGMSYEVGSGDLLPGVDEALAGMSAGESKTFGTQLAAGEYAGRNAEVTVTVRSVKEKELPELDDDFARTASEFDTLAELRTDIRSRVDRISSLTQALQARDRAVDALLAAVDVPLPESVVSGEVEWRQESIASQLEDAGMAMEDYLEQEGQTREQFDEELSSSAATAVKSQLVLDAVADAEQVGVSDEELTQHVISQARRSGMPPQQFAQQLSEAGNLPAMVAQVRRDKAVLSVVEAASVTDASGHPVDVSVLRAAMTPTSTPAEADEVDEDVADTSDEDVVGVDTEPADSGR